MSAVSSWFKPLKQIVDAIFRHDLALDRSADGVRVAFRQRGAGRGTGRAGPVDPAAAKEKQEVELMRRELGAVLDEIAETRDTMKHLAFVDQALGRKGLRALEQLPLQLMRQALDQLEGLVTNWSPVGLASLRAKMAVAIMRRESMTADAGPNSYRTSALMEETGPPRNAAGVVVLERDDEEALAAAYAAYAAIRNPGQPAVLPEMHGELDSPSARAARESATGGSPLPEVTLRQLQS